MKSITVSLPFNLRPCLHGNIFDQKCKLFFTDTRFIYTKTCTKTFSLQKHYPKWKLSKTQQKKCSVNNETVNSESVLYQAWSTTKVGVDSEKTMVKKPMLLASLLCCLILLQVNKAIIKDYRVQD